jgi:long-chain acyl-CoA synthetase
MAIEQIHTTPPTKAEIDAAVEGQTVARKFLANLALNGSVEVLRHQDDAGNWAAQTLDELAAEIARLVTALTEMGVGPGDRVVLMMRNRPEFHAIDLAVLFCGATPVSIYNSSAPNQISYLVNHCGAKVAFVEDDGFLARFDEVADELGALEGVVILDPSDATRPDVRRYADLLEATPADLASAATVGAPEDLATIIYTSGTTGLPKGVMLSNYNVCWTLDSVSRAMREQAEVEALTGNRHLSYLPMAHIMERLLGHYFLCDFAIEVWCCPDTGKLTSTLAAARPNSFVGVPRVWEKLHAGVQAALSADPEKAKSFAEGLAAAAPIAPKIADGTATEEERATYEFLDAVAFSTIRGLIGLDEAKICISGAAPLPPDVMTWFQTIGVPLSEGYGMSETTALLSWSHRARAGYVGRPAPGVEARLASDGEVLARGGNMFVGYLDAPEKTLETLDEEGWVHTGDIGEFDEDGYLKIVDRKKELLVTAGGKNVSPANLEAALKGIPLVGQACAVGDNRPFVAALVVLDPDASAAWAAARGLSGADASPQSLASNPEVIAEINAGLAEAMSEFNNAESVKKVHILAEEWLPDTDLLTPTSKLKRRGILARFENEIAELYQR